MSDETHGLPDGDRRLLRGVIDACSSVALLAEDVREIRSAVAEAVTRSACAEYRGACGVRREGEIENVDADVRRLETRIDRIRDEDRTPIPGSITGPIQIPQVSWWDAAQKRVAVLVGALTLIGLVVAGWLWTARQYAEMREVRREIRALTYEVRRVDDAGAR